MAISSTGIFNAFNIANNANVAPAGIPAEPIDANAAVILLNRIYKY